MTAPPLDEIHYTPTPTHDDLSALTAILTQANTAARPTNSPSGWCSGPVTRSPPSAAVQSIIHLMWSSAPSWDTLYVDAAAQGLGRCGLHFVHHWSGSAWPEPGPAGQSP